MLLFSVFWDSLTCRPANCNSFHCSRKKYHTAEDLKALFIEHQEVEHGRSIQIYTNGSKTDTEVGSAAVMNNKIISRKLNRQCSIFTAELQAIQDALVLKY